MIPVADPSSADAALARQALEAADDGDWASVLQFARAHLARISMTDPAAWPAIFAQIPPDVVRRESTFVIIEALIRSLTRGSVHVPPDLLGQVEAIEAGVPVRPTTRSILELFSRIESERLWGRLDSALAHGDVLGEHVRAHPSDESAEDLAPGAFILIGTTLLLKGRYEDALRAFHDAERSAAWTEHPTARFARAYLALCHLLADAPDQAERYVDAAPTRRTARPGTWIFLYESATLFVPLLRALADADRRAALTALDAIDERAERSPFGWLAVHARARIALLWGEPSQALVTARRAFVNLGAYAGPGTLVRSVLNADIADLALAQGDFDEAVNAAFDQDATAPAALLDAARSRLQPMHADDGPGGLRDSAGRRARAAVTRIDASGAGAPRNHALTEAARVLEETRSAAAAIETSLATRATLWALLRRAPDDRPLTDFARSPLQELGLLSPREREVFFALDTTAPLKQIGARLSVSENTLKTHLRSIYRKLGVASRRELAQLVRRAAVETRPGDEDAGASRVLEGPQPASALEQWMP